MGLDQLQARKDQERMAGSATSCVCCVDEAC